VALSISRPPQLTELANKEAFRLIIILLAKNR
jgi:hypothetical protein